MGRKYRLYTALPVIVFLLLGVPAALVFAGYAEPYLAPSDVPVHPGVVFVGLILSVFATAMLSGVLVRRSFATVGRSLGLSAEGGGFFGGHPDFTGTIDGRPVAVETRAVQTSTGGQGGSTSTTYTTVKAELDRPVADGFVLVDAEDDPEPRAADDVPDVVETVPLEDGFAVVGAANEPLAREVLTPAVKDALREPDAPDGLIVGDPAETIIDTLPEEMAASGAFFGGDGLEEKLREEIGGDAPTVSHETVGLPLDADVLDSRLQAMVTVADAVDAAGVERRDDEVESTA